MDGWINRWMEGQSDEWMDERTKGGMAGWIDTWMDG